MARHGLRHRLLGCLVALLTPATTWALGWRTLAPGLDYAKLPVTAGVTLHLLRLDPARQTLRVVQARETTAATSAGGGVALADAGEFRRAAGGAAAFNGGFFDPAFRPLGLLVSAGKTLAKLRRVDHGVFALAGGKASVQHAKSWQAPAGLEFAIECGPRLVVDGAALSFKDARSARRTVLGVDARGWPVAVVSDAGLSLAELAAWLVRPEASGGVGLRQALNLDGGPSTMLEVDAGGVRAAVRTLARVPVGVAVVAR